MIMIRSMLMLVLLLLVSAAATAATDCADWNTKAFAETADRARWHACLAAGADPTAREEDGSTPLHSAAVWGHASVVKILLDAGAKPDARSKYGCTPLHRAAGEGHASIVEALLAAGADPAARNEEGKTPFDVISSKLKRTKVYWELNDARYR